MDKFIKFWCTSKIENRFIFGVIWKQFVFCLSVVNVMLLAFLVTAIAAEHCRLLQVCYAAVDRHLLSGRSAVNRTDARPFHRPCSAYYAGSINKYCYFNMVYKQWCIAWYTRVYAVYQPPGFFGQRILTSVIINMQGTFRPFATPLCVYPPPFLAIHHCV